MAKKPIFYGWVVVAVAFVCMALGYAVMHSFSIFFVAIYTDFGWSRATTALASSIFMIMYGLVAPLTGAGVDRFGPRVVIPIGAVVMTLGLFATNLVSEPWHLYLTYGVIAAIGLNAVGTVPNVAVLTNWFAQRRGTALGFAAAGIGVGMLVVVPTLQWIIEVAGWRTAYVALGAVVLLVIPALAIAFHRHRPEDMGLARDGAQPRTGLAAGSPVPQMKVVNPAWANHPWDVRSAVSTGRFWLLFLGFLFGALALQSVMVHQVAFLADRQFDPMLGATIVAMVGLFGSLGKILWGWLSDRIGREGAYTAGMICISLGVLALASVVDVSQPWPAYLYTLVFGIGYGVFAPLMPSTAADIFQGKRFGSVYGVLYIGCGAGSALGPWLSGFIFDLTGGYTPAFAMAIATAGLSAGGYWLAAPRKVRQVPGFAKRQEAPVSVTGNR
ncbi:MAG: MFS transporter [Chloroflexota bacterium]